MIEKYVAVQQRNIHIPIKQQWKKLFREVLNQHNKRKEVHDCIIKFLLGIGQKYQEQHEPHKFIIFLVSDAMRLDELLKGNPKIWLS